MFVGKKNKFWVFYHYHQCFIHTETEVSTAQQGGTTKTVQTRGLAKHKSFIAADVIDLVYTWSCKIRDEDALEA